MAETLEQVLADMRGDAAVLRRHGDERVAVAFETFATRVAAASEDYLRFLSESDARLWSGHAVPWLLARFRELAPEGHAVERHGVRYYRAICLPRRVDADAAREAGRRAAGGAAGAA